ncbi:MAG: hypothetical protein ACLFTH_00420 [Candidatus Woesearchaeota archaeon]
MDFTIIEGRKSAGKKKGQSSIEYLFIVAIALLLIVPGTALFYQYSRNSQESLQHSQIFKIGSELVETGEMIYSVGENSWQTVEISFPDAVKSMTVYSEPGVNELEITYGDAYPSDAVFFTDNLLLNATGNESECSSGCKIPIRAGVNRIRVESGTEGEIRYRLVN